MGRQNVEVVSFKKFARDAQRRERAALRNGTNAQATEDSPTSHEVSLSDATGIEIFTNLLQGMLGIPDKPWTSGKNKKVA